MLNCTGGDGANNSLAYFINCILLVGAGWSIKDWNVPLKLHCMHCIASTINCASWYLQSRHQEIIVFALLLFLPFSTSKSGSTSFTKEQKTDMELNLLCPALSVAAETMTVNKIKKVIVTIAMVLLQASWNFRFFLILWVTESENLSLKMFWFKPLLENSWELCSLHGSLLMGRTIIFFSS